MLIHLFHQQATAGLGMCRLGHPTSPAGQSEATSLQASGAQVGPALQTKSAAENSQMRMTHAGEWRLLHAYE